MHVRRGADDAGFVGMQRQVQSPQGFVRRVEGSFGAVASGGEEQEVVGIAYERDVGLVHGKVEVVQAYTRPESIFRRDARPQRPPAALRL